MRREIIILQRREFDGSNPDASVSRTLLATGAEVADAAVQEEDVYGSETGRGEIMAKIAYTPKVARLEDDINAATFRRKQWNVVSKVRDHFRMTLGLERAGA